MQDFRVQLIYGSYCEPSSLLIGKSIAEAYELKGGPWAIPQDALPFRTINGFAPYPATPGTILKSGDTLEWIRQSKSTTKRAMARIKVTWWEDSHERYVGMTVGQVKDFLYARAAGFHMGMNGWRGIKRLSDSEIVNADDFIEFVSG